MYIMFVAHTKEKTIMKNKIIYWSTTGIISLMMLFSASQYFVNPEVKAGIQHLGYPDYFRIELAIAKIIGALIIIIPLITIRVKEWAYAGFAIVCISASIAHLNSGDPVARAITPIIFLGILILSNLYLHKLNPSKLS
ncbi:MAG: DoxX family protein [Sphingobacteriales bacterium]|nr:DoxX family protein [Sphingobacteriales bacterium]